MIPPTIPELVARAGQLPYLRDHLALAEGGTASANLPERTLGSAYEPIYDVTMPGAPQSTSFADTIDRLSRALHAINFFGAQRHGLLFLRVHERLLKSVKYDHGKHFSSVLQRFGLPTERIVIELPAVAVAHKTFLGYLTRSYQHHGFKVADKLPDPGRILAVESDMARPDYIKMDAGIALRDGMVKALVAYAQRVRIPLIFDGVVDETQCELLRQHDVRFMQGPVFAKVVTA